jgi:hypothetical protein
MVLDRRLPTGHNICNSPLYIHIKPLKDLLSGLSPATVFDHLEL